MVRIEIDEAEFAVVLAGLIRMAQGAKVARDNLVAQAEKAETSDQFDGLLDAAAHKQTIIDQAFATLSSVGKSARENMAELKVKAGMMQWDDNPAILDHLKWAADMWADIVGEYPILNADGTVFQRPERTK